MKTTEESIVVELRMIRYLLIVIALVLTLIAGILNVGVLAVVLGIVIAVSLLVLPLIFILRNPGDEKPKIGSNEDAQT